MDIEVRRKVLGLILGLAVKDGELAAAEEAFVERLYAKFGITMDDEPWVKPVGDERQAAAALRAMSPSDRREAMALLVSAAAVDGAVPPAEQVYLDAVAKAAGWSAAELEKRIVEELASDLDD